MGHYEELKTQNLGMDSDLYLVLKAKLMHKKSTEEVTIIGIPPITIISNGNNATVGLKGQAVQSGTPTPDNPIMPQGTGERTNNLCDESAIQQGYYGALGSYSVFTADTKYRCFKLDLPAGIYTLNISADENMYILRCSNSVDGAITVYSAPPYTFTLSADATIYVSWRNTDTTNSFTNMTVMLNTGSTALPYEKHGYKIPISYAEQTTPVYLGEVETTRKIKKLVLTGEETVIISGGNAPYRIYVNDIIQTTDKNAILFFCSHYQAVSNNAPWATYSSCVSWSFSGNTNLPALNFRDTSITSETDFKSFLQQQYSAGTPVTVWYVLATPETVTINEPLMKIGDYADTLSKTQAGVEIPTARGTNTLDVLTDVKPSEVYIKYKG